jgi:hypothetical protein
VCIAGTRIERVLLVERLAVRCIMGLMVALVVVVWCITFFVADIVLLRPMMGIIDTVLVVVCADMGIFEAVWVALWCHMAGECVPVWLGSLFHVAVIVRVRDCVGEAPQAHPTKDAATSTATVAAAAAVREKLLPARVGMTTIGGRAGLEGGETGLLEEPGLTTSYCRVRHDGHRQHDNPHARAHNHAPCSESRSPVKKTQHPSDPGDTESKRVHEPQGGDGGVALVAAQGPGRLRLLCGGAIRAERPFDSGGGCGVRQLHRWIYGATGRDGERREHEPG